MHLQIEYDDGTRTAFFGISDFMVTEGNNVRLAFHSDVALEADRKYRTEEGTVTNAVSETGYDRQGAYETIGDLAVEDGMTVVVAITDRYPWIGEAAHQLRSEDDFNGNLRIIEQQHSWIQLEPDVRPVGYIGPDRFNEQVNKSGEYWGVPREYFTIEDGQVCLKSSLASELEWSVDEQTDNHLNIVATAQSVVVDGKEIAVNPGFWYSNVTLDDVATTQV